MGKKEEEACSFTGHCVIYTYNISGLESSKRVRFVYLLKGRGTEKGIVGGLGGKFLAPGCFIIPYKKSAEMDDIFRLWNVKNKRYGVLTDKDIC